MVFCEASQSLQLSELGRLAQTAGCLGERSETPRPFYRLPVLRLGHSDSDGRFYLPVTVHDAWIFSEATK